MKYRLLICVDSFWPYQDGVSIVTQYLAKGIQKLGNEVIIYTNKRGMDLPDYEIYEGIQIRRISVISRWPISLEGTDKDSNPQSYLQAILELKPDVLLIENYGNWQFDWMINSINMIDCKKIFHFHAIYPDDEKYHIAQYLLRGNLYKARENYFIKKYWENAWKKMPSFDLILHLYKGSSSWNLCMHHNINQNAVLENAVEDIFLTENMHHVNVQKDETVFLCVANYNTNKNQELILKAYKAANFVGKTKLILIGNRRTKYLETLQELTKEIVEEEKEVILYVGLERSEVFDTFKYADVVVVSSKHEGSPVVLREAAASAMGIISTDVGDAKLIDGVQIIHDINDMIDSMVKMEDAKYRKYMGERARKWAQAHCNRNEKVECLDRTIQLLLNE